MVEPPKPQEIWSALLDGRFTCLVTRVDFDSGKLEVRDNTTSETIMECGVGLAFEARFGPDAGDVQAWQDLCTDAVDKYMDSHPSGKEGR